MKIRAITAFSTLISPTDTQTIARAAEFLHTVQHQFEENGFEVQTLRLALPPLTEALSEVSPTAMTAFGQWLEKETQRHGIEYVSAGSIIADTATADISAITAVPELIAATEAVFTSAVVASTQHGINLAAIHACADAVCRIGAQSADGFGNLRFAMLANVPADTPFFPGAYHHGSTPAFAIATEAADLAVTAFKNADSLAVAQQSLAKAIARTGEKLASIADALAVAHGFSFGGIDFSPAPFPQPEISIGAAIEHLGVTTFGGHGSLFATAFLTRILKEANPRPTGYNGVMFPVLEDPILAQRATEGEFGVNDLLLYSAVCGTGLDTIPIPGDSTIDQIAGVMLDVATLSVVLNKPLTARLLPVPGLSAVDATTFNFEFFANSAVLPLKGASAPNIFRNNRFWEG